MTTEYLDELDDLDGDAVAAQVRVLLREGEWPPTISQIRRGVFASELGQPDPEAAWSLWTRRVGDRDGQGDKSIVVSEMTRSALDAAGIDPWRYWTSEDRHWQRRAFIEVYTSMLNRAIQHLNVGPDPVRAVLEGKKRLGLPDVDDVLKEIGP